MQEKSQASIKTVPWTNAQERILPLLLGYKKVCTLFSVAFYIVLFFVLYPVIGTDTAILSVAPVIVVGWGYGFRGGLVAGLLTILLTTLLLNLAGYEPVGWDALVSREGGVLGSLFVVLVGMAIGKMSDLTRQLQQKIHDQQRTAETMEKSEELLRQITENIQEVFFVVDHKDYRVLYVSPSYEEIWGRTCESLLKSPTAWIEAIFPEDRERVLVAFDNQQRTGEFDEEFRIVRPDKSLRWIHDRVFPIRNARGEVYRLVGTALDITKRKQAEKEIQRLNEELEQRVMDRTAQLQVTNKELEKGITERKEAQEKLEMTQKELSNLSKHLIRSQELERRRIALELHDQLGQDLALLSIEIERLIQKPPKSQAQLAKRLQKLAMKNRGVSTYVQTLSHQLHPSSLELLGLVAASKSLCDEVSQASDIQIDFSHSDVPSAIPEDVSICFYRVLQESLTNIVKHSEVQAAQVELAGSPDKLLQLCVCDSGVGFDPESVGNDGGLGFVSMRERLNLVGGELLIESQPSAGTQIKASVPLPVVVSPD